MNKEELLQELSGKINTGEISREELVELCNPEDITLLEKENNLKDDKHFSVTKMLYFLGAAVVIIGIIIFVQQIWDDIGSLGRIVVTFGMGLLLTVIGSILLIRNPEENIGSVFHAIGGVLIPGGALVALYELHLSSISAWPVAITFGIISLFYAFLNLLHKNAVLTFFTISNSTIFVYRLVESIIGDSSYHRYDDLYAYLTMAVGISYLLLAYAFRKGWNRQLVEALYFFGSAGFLGAAFSRVFDSVQWQVLYFFIILVGIFLSTYVKNRSMLVISNLFLIAHISYITSKYFADSLGWPISLVILGFVFIGLGYMSIKINKKYIMS